MLPFGGTPDESGTCGFTVAQTSGGESYQDWPGAGTSVSETIGWVFQAETWIKA